MLSGCLVCGCFSIELSLCGFVFVCLVVDLVVCVCAFGLLISAMFLGFAVRFLTLWCFDLAWWFWVLIFCVFGI